MEPFPEPRHWYEVVGTLASERSCCHWCTLPAFTSLGLPQRNSFDSFLTGVQRGKIRKIGPHHYPLAGRTKRPEFRMYTGRTLVQRLGSKLNGSWPRVSQSKDSIQNVFKKCPPSQTVLWHIRHKDPTSARVAMKFRNLPTNEAFEETHLHCCGQCGL